ncbi:hypothetical protein SeMB42_g06747 [Synchytrium endobioticum]|uniref:Uncharacterized protein n=1 Tax=Synchytrium endobioticum TaxID=286115 RepID=A0A507CKP7_9FUNG|nr:hypothetical protein SeMB42_g06747 [Synchytrium endobioticum]
MALDVEVEFDAISLAPRLSTYKVLDIAIYSASQEDRATTRCLEEYQDTTPSPIKMTAPDCDFLSPTSLPHVESE